MTGLKSQHSTYKYCQYMYVSSQTLLHAISLFSSTKEGDLERSFSALHKAWVLLFQADTLLKENGFLNSCNCSNKKEFNCGKPKCIAEGSKEKFVYTLEQGLNSIGNKTTDTSIKLPNQYKFHNGSGLFKLLNEKGNFYKNLSIVRTLRNIDQHDYMEVKPNEFIKLMDITRPYVIANVRNYMETYNEMFIFLKNEKKHKNPRYCSCNILLSPTVISSRCFFPWSYKSIFDSGSILWDTEEDYFNSLDYLKEEENRIINQKNTMKKGIKKLEDKLEKTSHPKAKENIQKDLDDLNDKLSKVEDGEKEIEDKISTIRKLTEIYYEKNPGRESNLRREFYEAITAYSPSPEYIHHLHLDIPPYTAFAINNSLNKGGNSAPIFRNIHSEMIHSYIKSFKFKELSGVVKALKTDISIPLSIKEKITWQKLKPLEEAIMHVEGDLLRAEFYEGELRYTQNFYDYVKSELYKDYMEKIFLPILNRVDVNENTNFVIADSFANDSFADSFILKKNDKFYKITNEKEFIVEEII